MPVALEQHGHALADICTRADGEQDHAQQALEVEEGAHCSKP
eukprot:CAMPEP_0114614960 /NCGR_PEP_ID=MMETSP0168-20121206/5921_1 /TAXON_ID=95228 ORGANISM="Vannella sp., Strain DIVA3 517/6/12" /NCGR_SAMPLE_ID=MMETSP0168 /ASSEMBLY_ACC=CAM_ASM_000044 /LENGTH=41 /DNA_ID= /DNA_START= /DNA_END= /DNA_ORIENTATION=